MPLDLPGLKTALENAFLQGASSLPDPAKSDIINMADTIATAIDTYVKTGTVTTVDTITTAGLATTISGTPGSPVTGTATGTGTGSIS